MERGAEMEVIPASQEYGLGVIPWSPLHGGLLGGAVRKEREGGGARSTSGRSGEALADPKVRAQIQAYEDLLDKHGLEPGEVGLAWLLTRPGITGPISGPRTRSSSTRRCARWSWSCRRRCWTRWKRSSPARARRRRTSPGRSSERA